MAFWDLIFKTLMDNSLCIVFSQLVHDLIYVMGLQDVFDSYGWGVLPENDAVINNV